MTEALLRERLKRIESDMAATKDRADKLDAELLEMANRLQALNGARQECNYWLAELQKPHED